MEETMLNETFIIFFLLSMSVVVIVRSYHVQFMCSMSRYRFKYVKLLVEMKDCSYEIGVDLLDNISEYIDILDLSVIIIRENIGIVRTHYNDKVYIEIEIRDGLISNVKITYNDRFIYVPKHNLARYNKFRQFLLNEFPLFLDNDAKLTIFAEEDPYKEWKVRDKCLKW